jgi:hypothetical protein
LIKIKDLNDTIKNNIELELFHYILNNSLINILIPIIIFLFSFYFIILIPCFILFKKFGIIKFDLEMFQIEQYLIKYFWIEKLKNNARKSFIFGIVFAILFIINMIFFQPIYKLFKFTNASVRKSEINCIKINWARWALFHKFVLSIKKRYKRYREENAKNKNRDRNKKRLIVKIHKNCNSIQKNMGKF